jgi:hypothetical protein
MDGTMCVLRYVCMKEGMYSKSTEEAYWDEKVSSLIYNTMYPNFKSLIKDGKMKLGQKIKITIDWWKDGPLESALNKLTEICADNIRRTGFATHDYFSMADVCLVCFLSKTSKNVLLEKELAQITSKYPWVDQYWNTHNVGKLKEWFTSRRQAWW